MAEYHTYQDCADSCQNQYSNQILLAVADGKIRELFQPYEAPTELSFLTAADKIGHNSYVRSLVMLLFKAASDITDKNVHLKLEFSIGSGLFISVKGAEEPNGEYAQRLKHRMQELAAKDIPFEKKAMPRSKAMKLFSERGMDDKVLLFKFRQTSWVNVYFLEDFCDYFYGYMVPSTGYLKTFDVLHNEEGILLLHPAMNAPDSLPEPSSWPKLFATMQETTRWNACLGIDTVGQLNEQICQGKTAEMILVQEALQERKIAEIASEIASRPGVKFVMIAGPSSSGKTSFSHRLSIQLKTHGLTPHPIEVDNYFVEREDTPRDADGKYNFECLEAVDLELFNRHMTQLLEGKAVELPTFDFLEGHKEYKGNVLQLGEDDILVIEGIHCLNDRLSYALPAESKYKIYISALTCLNVDEHSRIRTTDGRLLRRMVRDARTRGSSAKKTIAQWPSVRRGEEENIFPYQESADVMFNSSLIYELCALKPQAEQLLYQVDPEDPEYNEAKWLLKFLDYFMSISCDDIPHNSIVREFVGGSCFKV